MKEENVMIKDDADDKLKEEKDDSDVTDDEVRYSQCKTL